LKTLPRFYLGSRKLYSKMTEEHLAPLATLALFQN